MGEGGLGAAVEGADEAARWQPGVPLGSQDGEMDQGGTKRGRFPLAAGLPTGTRSPRRLRNGDAVTKRGAWDPPGKLGVRPRGRWGASRARTPFSSTAARLFPACVKLFISVLFENVSLLNEF